MRREDLMIGTVIKFFDLWDGNGDGEQLFEDGSIAVGISEYGKVFECVVDFEVVEENEENVLDSLVKITDVDFSEIEEFEDEENEKKFEVLEDNAGGLTLAVFGESGEVEYLHSGYEDVPWTLKRDIEDLKSGDDPAVEWEGNAENPQAEYNEIVSFENGFEVVADNDGIYPERMGAAAKLEFGYAED